MEDGWVREREGGDIKVREALDPTPPKPKYLSRFRSGFRRSHAPCPGSPGGLIHSCPLCRMTFEPGKIIALEQITYNR